MHHTPMVGARLGWHTAVPLGLEQRQAQSEHIPIRQENRKKYQKVGWV